MSDVVEELLKVADEQDAIELKIFKNAVIKTLKEYQESPTRANKNNMDAARDNLKQKKEDMVAKYLSSPEDCGTAPSFPSLLKVLEHLTRSGFRISKSKLYRDRDKSLIRVNPDGSVLESEVRAYAASSLERVAGNIDDMSDIQVRKALKDMEFREEQILKIRQAREVNEGKFIPRRDFEAELASRAVVMEVGFRQHYRLNVGRWIALVGGKREKSAELLDELTRGLEAQLSSYSNMDTFLVMYEGEKE